jgi:hypothetical protein
LAEIDGALVEGDFFWLFLAFLLVEGLQLGFGYMNAWWM